MTTAITDSLKVIMPVEETLPFLTTEYLGLGGFIRSREEDFLVEELPLYQPGGVGTHSYALVEKRRIGTFEAMARIANALSVPRTRIGFAGLKDAHAVARQWISIEHMPAEKLLNLKIPDLQILQVHKHSNKIKLGHLAGNRFVIYLRKTKIPVQQGFRLTEDILSILDSRGVPNYFGPQRFGNRKDNHLLGGALLKNRGEDFMDRFLGTPITLDSARVMKARSLYERGEYLKAYKAWPYEFADHRRALRAMIKSQGNKQKALKTISKSLKNFYISAYQSHIFNQVVAARMPDIDTILMGDIAYKHLNGACFRVTDPELDQQRCDNFEISPTGPILGTRMTNLTGPAGEIENKILEQLHLQDTDLHRMRAYHARSGRRPVRFKPRNMQVSTGHDELGTYIRLCFELDAGCYATSLIREITKTDLS